MRRVIVGLAVVVGAIGVAAFPGADPPGADATAGGGADAGVIWANVQFGTPASPGGADASGCRWRPARPHDAGIGSSGEVTRTVADVLQRLYERSCPSGFALVWVSQPTPGRLGQLARDVVIARLPAPVPRTAPPAGAAVVNSNVWFWTETSAWEGVSVTAWVPTPEGVLWSTTTAIPARLWLVPNAPDSAAVGCSGPGRPWTPIDGDDVPSPCSITFLHDSSLAPAGRFPSLMAIDWAISWTASTGSGGSLTGHRTTSSLPIRVSEIQALVTEVRR